MEKQIQTEKYVTKDMTIGEVLDKYSYLTEIMLGYGLHCVGCHVNPYESIENGCLGHGMSSETVDKLVDDLNKTIEEHKDIKELTITNKAKEKLNEFMKSDNKEGYGLRLTVLGGCCGGTTNYDLDFSKEKNEDEVVLSDNGINLFVNSGKAEELHGIKIDFISNKKGEGFKVESSLDVKQGCGCH